jgi:UPF0716 protein FxsA
VLLVIALCVIVPVVEIAVFVQVAHWIGGWEALFLLLAISLAGAWLVKLQGVSVVRRISADLQARRVPGRAIVDGGLIAVAALLLLIPGFVTAVVGLVLLIPLTRVPVRDFLVRRWTRRYPVRVVTAATSRWTAVDADSTVVPERSDPQELGGQRAVEPGREADGIV